MRSNDSERYALNKHTKQEDEYETDIIIRSRSSLCDSDRYNYPKKRESNNEIVLSERQLSEPEH